MNHLFHLLPMDRLCLPTTTEVRPSFFCAVADTKSAMTKIHSCLVRHVRNSLLLIRRMARHTWLISPDSSCLQSYDIYVAAHSPTRCWTIDKLISFFLLASARRIDFCHLSYPLNNDKLLPLTASSIMTTVGPYTLFLWPFAMIWVLLCHIPPQLRRTY